MKDEVSKYELWTRMKSIEKMIKIMYHDNKKLREDNKKLKGVKK